MFSGLELESQISWNWAQILKK